MPSAELDFVIKLLEGCIDFFEESPKEFARAEGKDNVLIWSEIVEGRVNQKKKLGETSQLVRFSGPGGAAKLQAMVENFADDDGVAILLTKLPFHHRLLS